MCIPILIVCILLIKYEYVFLVVFLFSQKKILIITL
jgi:hypothetical protein